MSRCGPHLKSFILDLGRLETAIDEAKLYDDEQTIGMTMKIMANPPEDGNLQYVFAVPLRESLMLTLRLGLIGSSHAPRRNEHCRIT